MDSSETESADSLDCCTTVICCTICAVPFSYRLEKIAFNMQSFASVRMPQGLVNVLAAFGASAVAYCGFRVRVATLLGQTGHSRFSVELAILL